MNKTLIFNGSPRKNGDTAYLIGLLKEELKGDVMVVDVYDANIRPCIDCRYCFEKKGCAIKDDMETVYSYIRDCDHILLASPIYFGELSGQLLAVMSRLQTYFSARFIRKEEPIPKKKTGGSLLTAGSFGPREKAEDTAGFLLKQLSTEVRDRIYLDNTDKTSLRDRELAPRVRQFVKMLESSTRENC